MWTTSPRTTTRSADDLKDYYEILGSVAKMEQTIRNSALVAESVSAKARKPTPVWTALDEWNIINNWADGSKRRRRSQIRNHL